MKNIFNQKGALLMEILLAVTIGAIIIGAVAGLVYVSSKSGQQSGAKSAAISLAEEGLEAIQSIGESDWHDIYLPPSGLGDFQSDKGALKPYYVYKNGSSWALEKVIAGNEGDVLVDNMIYTRNIYIENVDRKKIPERPICTETETCLPSEKVNDPSTQKIRVVVSRTGSADVVLEEYLTRWKNETSSQSDWSGGPGQADFVDPSKYGSDDGNIDTSIPGSLKLKPL